MHKLFISIIMLSIFCSCSKQIQPKVISGDKLLIVNADDLCMNDETSNAIIDAYRNGIVTSTSAFVTFAEPVSALKRIHSEDPDLPIGIHLNITEGKPLLPAGEIPSLVDKNGNFFSPDQIMSKLPDMKIEDVRKELNAQVQLFISSGVPLDHINCHHHITALYTPFHSVMREICLQYNVPMRNPVPYSIYKKMNVNKGSGGASAAKEMIVYGLLHPFKSFPMMKVMGPAAFIEQEKINNEAGIKMPDWFIDSFFENASVSDLNSIIMQLPNGVSEIMCHPGRAGEVKVLSDPDVKTTLEKSQVRLVKFDTIK